MDHLASLDRLWRAVLACRWTSRCALRSRMRRRAEGHVGPMRWRVNCGARENAVQCDGRWSALQVPMQCSSLADGVHCISCDTVMGKVRLCSWASKVQPPGWLRHRFWGQMCALGRARQCLWASGVRHGERRAEPMAGDHRLCVGCGARVCGRLIGPVCGIWCRWRLHWMPRICGRWHRVTHAVCRPRAGCP